MLRFQLDGPLRRIERWEVLEAYAPWMEGPTTGAIDGDSFLYLANTQLRRWLAQPHDMAELVPVQVRRITLRKTAPAR